MSTRFYKGFEWNPYKCSITKADRNICFEYAARIFDDPDYIEVPALSETEERTMVIGKIEGKVFAVIITLREGSIRIISARRARSNEEKLYG